MQLRLGTRASPLARWQADWVSSQLAARGVKVELVYITTQGDEQVAGPIGGLGEQGVFTKEIQRALLDGRVDLAVHSLKDLPTAPVQGLVLAAVPPRESTGDALVIAAGGSFEQLPLAARVGTGSLRRKAQLWHARPDLKITDVRGNVDTRLRKLDEGQYDALVLAEAGLKRLGLAERISQILPREMMLPAVGQGALGLETRSDDAAVRAAVAPLDDPATRAAVLAERALLHALRGGCLAPVGAHGRVENSVLRLSAVVLSGDGRRRAAAEGEAAPEQAEQLGQTLSSQLLGQGAADMIASARAAGSG